MECTKCSNQINVNTFICANCLKQKLSNKCKLIIQLNAENTALCSQIQKFQQVEDNIAAQGIESLKENRRNFHKHLQRKRIEDLRDQVAHLTSETQKLSEENSKVREAISKQQDQYAEAYNFLKKQQLMQLQAKQLNHAKASVMALDLNASSSQQVNKLSSVLLQSQQAQQQQPLQQIDSLSPTAQVLLFSQQSQQSPLSISSKPLANASIQQHDQQGGNNAFDANVLNLIQIRKKYDDHCNKLAERFIKKRLQRLSSLLNTTFKFYTLPDDGEKFKFFIICNETWLPLHGDLIESMFNFTNNVQPKFPNLNLDPELFGACMGLLVQFLLQLTQLLGIALPLPLKYAGHKSVIYDTLHTSSFLHNSASSNNSNNNSSSSMTELPLYFTQDKQLLHAALKAFNYNVCYLCAQRGIVISQGNQMNFRINLLHLVQYPQLGEYRSLEMYSYPSYNNNNNGIQQEFHHQANELKERSQMPFNYYLNSKSGEVVMLKLPIEQDPASYNANNVSFKNKLNEPAKQDKEKQRKNFKEGAFSKLINHDYLND